MNGWVIIVWVSVMAAVALANVTITFSGYRPSHNHETRDDPSPGPTAWH